MRLFACLLAAWVVAAPAAAQNSPVPSGAPLCRHLLTLVEANGDSAGVRLGSCDVDVIVGEAGGGLAVRPRDEGLARALAPDGRLFAALLDARLRLQPSTASRELAGFPGGLLLASESERLVREGHWRWSRSQRTLRWLPPAQQAGADACREFAGQRLLLWGGAPVRQAGEVLAPRPFVPGHAPGFERFVPPACVGSWSLSAGAPAVIDRQTGVVLVQPLRGAVTPQPFTITAAVGDATATGTVLAFDPQQQPLVGEWAMQQSSGCELDAAAFATAHAQHLRFGADGQFAARAVPFEARWDAWGRYELREGQLTLRIEDGNETGGLQQVAARVQVQAGGQVVLSDVVATPGGHATTRCSWTLRREG